MVNSLERLQNGFTSTSLQQTLRQELAELQHLFLRAGSEQEEWLKGKRSVAIRVNRWFRIVFFVFGRRVREMSTT